MQAATIIDDIIGWIAAGINWLFGKCSGAVMPVSGAKFRTPYDFPYYASGNWHRGTDMGADENAPAGPNPVESHPLARTVPPNAAIIVENSVLIKSVVNGTAYQFRYAHMSSIIIPTGTTTVTQKQQLGYVGSTGDVTGPHLHFEVRKPPYARGTGPSDTDAVSPKSFY